MGSTTTSGLPYPDSSDAPRASSTPASGDLAGSVFDSPPISN